MKKFLLLMIIPFCISPPSIYALCAMPQTEVRSPDHAMPARLFLLKSLSKKRARSKKHTIIACSVIATVAAASICALAGLLHTQNTSEASLTRTKAPTDMVDTPLATHATPRGSQPAMVNPLKYCGPCSPLPARTSVDTTANISPGIPGTPIPKTGKEAFTADARRVDTRELKSLLTQFQNAKRQQTPNTQLALETENTKLMLIHNAGWIPDICAQKLGELILNERPPVVKFAEVLRKLYLSPNTAVEIINQASYAHTVTTLSDLVSRSP